MSWLERKWGPEGSLITEDGMCTSHSGLISTSDGARAGLVLCRGSHFSWLHRFFSTGKITHFEYMGNLQHHFKIEIGKNSVPTVSLSFIHTQPPHMHAHVHAHPNSFESIKPCYNVLKYILLYCIEFYGTQHFGRFVSLCSTLFEVLGIHLALLALRFFFWVTQSLLGTIWNAVQFLNSCYQ